ncbi:ABC transporter permease [Pendulispora rubella]|uniref:ABC transporter permease n=1 Tax=Pendulispora rubella TaxID=2741070 RepID=A0ABZ2L5V7_9BACT
MNLVKLAWRNLLRNKRRTYITLASISSGCAFALFIFALIGGIHKKTIEDAARMLAGQITVEHPDYRDAPGPGLFVPSVAAMQAMAAKIPGIESVKPLVAGQGMIASGAGSVGVAFLGVDPAIEGNVSPLARNMVRGRFLLPADVESRGVVIGTKLAERLHVDLGNKVVLTTTDTHGEVVEELFRVMGIFKLGSDALDGGLVEMPLALARGVIGLGEDQATQVGFLLENPDSEERIIVEIRRTLAGQPVAVYSWTTLLPALASWEASGTRGHRVICAVVIFLASFTILNTILMSVVERKREFAMLLALGTSPARLRVQVFLESFLLGLGGCAVGLALGSIAALITARQGIDLRGSVKDGAAPTVGNYAVSLQLRPTLTLEDVAFVGVLVLVLTMIIAIYPTLRSTRIHVANTLRSN